VIRESVISTELRSVGYQPVALILEVEFRSGGIYQYFGVPAFAHAALMSAPSKGRYFNAHIKSIYRYQRIG
jgi:hypothetical protein